MRRPCADRQTKWSGGRNRSPGGRAGLEAAAGTRPAGASSQAAAGEGARRPVLPAAHTRPHRPGLARREALAGRHQQWGVRRRRGRGRRRLHRGPHPRSRPRSPRNDAVERRGEGRRAGSSGAAQRRQGRTVCSRAGSRPATGPSRRPGRSATRVGGGGLGPHVPG